MLALKNPALPSLILIISCLFLILVTPLVSMESSPLIFSINYIIIYLSALFTLKASKILRWIIIVSIMLQFVTQIMDLPVLEVLSFIGNFVFFIFIVIKLTLVIAAKKEVTPVVMLDAVSAYLLIGISFFIVNLLVARSLPGSFIGPGGNVEEMESILYYTFVTYTTLGYGEILPGSSITRSLSNFCALSGQVYLTLVIALIVGKYLAKSTPA